MSKSSKSWLKTRARDAYVKQARQARYRSRAVYKLAQIDARHRLFKTGQRVVDLGCAPGGWSQYASRRIGAAGSVVAVDVLLMQPIPGVSFVKGDVREAPVYARCLQQLEGEGADLVISDMAPKLSGIKSTDQARSMHLVKLACDFAQAALKPGGTLLVKLFQGSEADAVRKEIAGKFQRLITCKPRASRAASREFYVLARLYGL